MTTPEQQAREILEKATSSDLPVIVADIIAENAALKAEFKIIDEMNDQLREQNEAVGEACAKLEAELTAIKQGAGEPVAWLSPGGDVSRSAKYFEEMGFTDLQPLYTRPATPLTNEQIWSLAAPHITYYQLGEATHRDINCLEFARALEAAHNIKGAKG